VIARLITDIAAIIAVAISLAGCGRTGGAPTAAPTTVTTYPVGGVDTPGSPPVPRAPEPGDSRVDVIVTGKQCFGPASCIYHYDIDPWPTDSYPPQLPGHTAMTVIYTVTGGDQD
jgi:hypothetical protein